MTDTVGGLRDRLVREAIALLDQGGTDISLRAVARAAGVSAMAPYRHFPDKAALLLAIADHGFGLLGEALAIADQEGARSGDDREALIAQGLAYLDFARAYPSLYRLMFADHDVPPASGKTGQGAFGVMAARVAGLTSDPVNGALACWAVVHGLATLARDGRLVADSGQARSVLVMLARGVADG